MDRKIRNQIESEKAYSERIKVGRRFYARLFHVFLAAAVICGCGLGYLYFWLIRYESRSTNGAMNSYMKLVSEQKWDEIYSIDTEYFTELNSKDSYISYLKNLYSDATLTNLSYTRTSSDDTTGNEFYDVYSDSSKISSLELTKPDSSDKWKVRTIGNEKSFSFDMLDSKISLSINGVTITSDYPNETDQVPYAFQDLGLDSKMPSVTRYTISSFIGTPEITLSGSDSAMAVKDSTSDLYYIGEKPTDDQYAEFVTEIEDTAFAYCKYISQDGTFYQLNKHLYPNTTFYNNMAGFNNQYFSTHNSIDFQNMTFTDVMPIGDNAFIGSISFDYVVTATDVSKTYSNSYQLFFVKNSKGLWKLTNLALLN